MKNRLTRLGMLLLLLVLLAAACNGDGLEGDDGDADAAADGGGEEEAADVDAEGGEIEGDSLEGSTIVVGSKDFDEQLILGNISKLVLEDAGVTVEDEIGLGGTDANRAALTGGQIDHYWEYNGTAWISFFGEEDPIADRIEQYEVVAERDLEENDLVWLDPAEFNNTYALAMSQERWEELGQPETKSDIVPLLEEDPNLSICVEVEFQSRNDGLPGMEETYGFEFDNVEVLDTGLIYTQTAQGNCDFGEVFTSDGRISALDLVVLEDDEGFFPLYNPSPVFRSDIYDPVAAELDELFNPISAALTLDEMTRLNERVSEDLERPEDVARDWLEENGFLEA
jgi:osmoprotectant transport system substrate-binding protein